MQYILNTSSCVCQQAMEPAALNEPEATRPISNLELVANFYMSIHGVLSLVVCAFGIPMNVLNITVLTHKNMRTPVNCILTWLAVFDLLTMVSYVPFSLHFYCLTWSISAERNSLGWMTFLIFHIDFTSTTHTISIWLGVTLAMFRYKHIFSPAKGYLTRVRRLIRARIAVFIVVILSVLIMIPNYLMNQLKSYEHFNYETNTTETVYLTEPLNLEPPEVKPLAQINLLLHSSLAKFLPCILMVVYGGLLVKTLRTNRRLLNRSAAARGSETYFPACTSEPTLYHPQEDHQENVASKDTTSIPAKRMSIKELQGPRAVTREMLCLKCSSQVQAGTSANTRVVYLKPSTSLAKGSSKRCSSTPHLAELGRNLPQRNNDNSRTTRMLLVVITLFLVTELPQAILIVLSATINGFFFDVYVPLGDMMDMIALINNGINFLLYCVMSRDFRTTLIDMTKTTLDRASQAPAKITTAFRKPIRTVVEQTEQSHATLIARAKDFR